MEKSDLFRRLTRMAGSERLEGHRGLSVVHSRILDRLEAYETAQFEKKLKKISLRDIPVNYGGRRIASL